MLKVMLLSYVKWVDKPADFDDVVEDQVDSQGDDLEDGIPF